MGSIGGDIALPALLDLSKDDNIAIGPINNDNYHAIYILINMTYTHVTENKKHQH